jgi:hypothetical protein
MSIPHGLLGKAYFASALVIASVIMTAVSIAIIVMPFWMVVCIGAAILIPAVGFLIWISHNA